MVNSYLRFCGNAISCLLFALMVGMVSCNRAPEPQEADKGFASLSDLEGHRVAIITGSTSGVLLSDTNNFSNIDLMYCSSPSELLAAIKNDSADCGITDTVVLMNVNMEEQGLKIDFNLPGGFDVAAAFNMKDEKLCRQYNDFIMQIKQDGTLDEMLARWCAKETASRRMPDMPELVKLKGHPIEVATMLDNAPFSYYHNNVWIGLEVEMMMRFSLFVGRPVHFSGYHFDEVIDVLTSDKADMAVANLFVTPERADRVLFSAPYYFCKTSCFSKMR